MILIVEGSNRVGKSTLIESIVKNAEESGKEVILYNERIARNNEILQTKDAMYEYGKHALEKVAEINNDKNLIIFDRFHLSELVYGAYYRKYMNYGMHMLDLQLCDMLANLVWIVSYYDHITDEENKKKYREIQSLFSKAYETSFMKKKIYFMNDISEVESIAKEVIEWIF